MNHLEATTPEGRKRTATIIINPALARYILKNHYAAANIIQHMRGNES